MSDANSVHPEDVPTEGEDGAEGEDQPSPSTSAHVVTVHTQAPPPVAAPRGHPPGGRRGRGGYGALSRSPQTEDPMDANPEYRGAVGGVGVYVDDEDDQPPRTSELRGIVSSDPDSDDEIEEENTSLRVKIISLFKSRGGRRDRRRRRNTPEDA